MNIDELTKDYRSLKAPPGLLQAVAAGLEEREAARRLWPGLIGIAVTASLAGVMFLMLSSAPEPVSVAVNVPSLSSLSKIRLQKPQSVSPSLANIRSVPVPPTPLRPKLIDTKPGKEDASIDNPQEKAHAHV